MNYIHLALFIGIAICLLWIGWKRTLKEGFDQDDSLVFTNEQCPLFSSQMAGYKKAAATALAENKFSSARMYEVIIEQLKIQMTAAGCSGNEKSETVPLALPASMSSTDVEVVTESPPVIDLSTVPVITSPAATTSS